MNRDAGETKTYRETYMPRGEGKMYDHIKPRFHERSEGFVRSYRYGYH